MTSPENLEALEQLLIELFTECGSLRRFVATTSGASKLVHELPGAEASIQSVAHKVARGFVSHGLLNVRLFERLRAERPLRSSDIDSVAQRFEITLERIAVTEPIRTSTSDSLAKPDTPQTVRPDLLQRFLAEPGGRRRLISVLQEQAVVGQEPTIAASLADAAQLQHYPVGACLVQQDEADTDILLILVGRATIMVNGCEVAVRRAGQHVGEMAMIDPAQRRSATITAQVETVVARVTEDDFARIASDFPQLWRRLAVELGARLRERGRLVRPRQSRPLVFIGSTDAGLPLAREFATALKDDRWHVRVWRDGPHGIGKSSHESLIAQLDQLSFGLLILAEADLALSDSRGTSRDRLIFQLGLLAGTLGQERTLVAKVGGADDGWSLPVQMGGVRCLDIDPAVRSAPPEITAVADEIRAIITYHFER